MIAMRAFDDLAFVAKIDQMHKRKSGRKLLSAVYAKIFLALYVKNFFYADHDNKQYSKRAYTDGDPKPRHIFIPSSSYLSFTVFILSTIIIPKYWT
jgi:hypothetical protein